MGIWVRWPDAETLDSLEVSSPTYGWSAEVFVTDAPVESFDALGPPVATLTEVPAGEAVVDLEDRRGGAVLVWLTDLGDGSRVRATIGEVEVRPEPERS